MHATPDASASLSANNTSQNFPLPLSLSLCPQEALIQDMDGLPVPSVAVQVSFPSALLSHPSLNHPSTSITDSSLLSNR